MGHRYRRRSFSTWAFWLALFCGGTLYGAYRFDWFPLGFMRPAAAPDEQGRAVSASADNSPAQSPPDGQVQVAENAVGPQSEPTPTELDDPAANAATNPRSAKARLLAQHAEAAKPNPTTSAPPSQQVVPANAEKIASNDNPFDTDEPKPKSKPATGEIIQASHAVVEPERPTTDPALAARLAKIDECLQTNDLLRAHRDLSTMYWSKPQWRHDIRTRIEKTARAIYFDPQIHFLEPYVVKVNDQFTQFAKRYDVPWQYLAKLNQVDPKRIRPGQKLKVIKGPFAAIVELDGYLLTVHAFGYYVRSYKVGAGKDGSTPIGKFTVLNKVSNPQYTDPQGRVIDSDDPNNPLGERWIDLGNGYGIHGTTDPASITKAESRGCIRMRNEDVEEVYDMLGVGSEVAIRG